ncbi:MAG: 16S rRNA (cytosine(1402)-N(4))-methyltransferase RsmH [Myxococcota bacterium]
MNVVNVPIPMSKSSYPPPPPTPRPEERHRSVLLKETVAVVGPSSSGIYVDVTLGAGGHSEGLLAAGAGHVIGLDRDGAALELAQRRLARFGTKVDFVEARFSQLRVELDRLGIDRVEGIIADLGVSSMQLDECERGMSFRREGPIDMRMDPEAGGETALELIARVGDDDLADIIFDLGEERRSRRIARCIKQAFGAGELTTTRDLRRAIIKAVGPNRQGNVDPATKTFQALRMAVNDELREIEALIDRATAVLVPGGTLAVISFHSLEDRIVKRKLREPAWLIRSKKPVLPSADEVDDNPRARSAKLRFAELRPGVPDRG